MEHPIQSTWMSLRKMRGNQEIISYFLFWMAFLAESGSEYAGMQCSSLAICIGAVESIMTSRGGWRLQAAAATRMENTENTAGRRPKVEDMGS